MEESIWVFGMKIKSNVTFINVEKNVTTHVAKNLLHLNETKASTLIILS
jgi:hypothetical protein